MFWVGLQVIFCALSTCGQSFRCYTSSILELNCIFHLGNYFLRKLNYVILCVQEHILSSTARATNIRRSPSLNTTHSPGRSSPTNTPHFGWAGNCSQHKKYCSPQSNVQWFSEQIAILLFSALYLLKCSPTISEKSMARCYLNSRHHSRHNIQ